MCQHCILLAASAEGQTEGRAALERDEFWRGELKLLRYVDTAGGTGICINSSVRLNAYLCGVKENGFWI